MTSNYLLLTNVGSHMWGMNHAQSDLDLFAIRLASTRDVLLGTKYDKSKHLQFIDPKVDIAEHELAKSFRYLADGNVNFVWGFCSPIVMEPVGELEYRQITEPMDINCLDTRLRMIGRQSISKKLERLYGKGLDFGDVFEHEGIKIELIPGYTSRKPTHPKNAGGAGTIVEIEGKKIYHAGDSDRIPEMKELASRNITVALLPCGGQYTMDMDMATDCVLDIKPEIVVPMHNWDEDLSKFKELMAKKDPNIKVEILENKTLKI